MVVGLMFPTLSVLFTVNVFRVETPLGTVSMLLPDGTVPTQVAVPEPPSGQT
jgi:hypothetical protein